MMEQKEKENAPTPSQYLNYDPNVVSRHCKQKIHITFGCWEYRATHEIEVYGNVMGFEAIESAIASFYDALPEVEKDIPYLRLRKGERQHRMVLDLEDEEGRGSDWLKDYVMSATIISLEKEDK